MQKYMDDLFLFVGFCLILIGVYKVNPLYVYFVSGVICVGMGIIIGISTRRDK